MTGNPRDDLSAELMAGADDRDPEPADQEVMSLLEIADRLWESGRGAPPLESDPVAAMLGLVPDPHYALDSKALSRARKNAKVSAAELARRLSARGWKVATGDVFRWENRSGDEVSPALLRAIAEETNSTSDLLTRPARAATPQSLKATTETVKFQSLAERWARLQNIPQAQAVSVLRSRLATTVHRGDIPDSDQLLRSLDALVTALEREGER